MLTSDDLQMLAFDAVSCMIARTHVVVNHPPEGWPKGFPLPVKRVPGDTQSYRPLAVLEWVNEKLGELQ